MAEPSNPTPVKFRDLPMFKASLAKERHRHKPATLDGQPYPTISELLMWHVRGSPAEKLAWLQTERAAGRLDGDDPEEIAKAEALLGMLARLSASKARGEVRLHLDALLDEALEATFPASDPVSVGHFTSTELR